MVAGPPVAGDSEGGVPPLRPPAARRQGGRLAREVSAETQSRSRRLSARGSPRESESSGTLLGVRSRAKI